MDCARRDAPLLPAANAGAYMRGRRVPHVLHGLWSASFYGGFGVLSVTRQLWFFEAFCDLITNPLGLQSVSELTGPVEAQDMLQLMGFPYVALGLYYLRHRYDAAFMLSSVFARLLAGGVGIMFVMLVMHKIPTGCWLLWACDTIPGIICYLDLRGCKSTQKRSSLSSFHGIYGAIFYAGLGFLGVSHNLDVVTRLAPNTFFVMQPHAAQHAMRLFGLPFMALGMYFVLHRKDPDFLLSTVYARLVGGPGGALFCFFIFRRLPGSIALLALGEVPAALFCLWELKATGTTNFRSVQPKTKKTGSGPGKPKKPSV